MKQRPDRSVAEPVVELFNIMLVQEDRMTVVCRQRTSDTRFLIPYSLERDTRPADPYVFVRFQQGTEAGGQTTYALAVSYFTLSFCDCDR